MGLKDDSGAPRTCCSCRGERVAEAQGLLISMATVAPYRFVCLVCMCTWGLLCVRQEDKDKHYMSSSVPLHHPLSQSLSWNLELTGSAGLAGQPGSSRNLLGSASLALGLQGPHYQIWSLPDRRRGPRVCTTNTLPAKLSPSSPTPDL